MPAVNNVLVVGGGAAGTATAILLAAAGVAVDLVEIKPDLAAVGSGITLQGNALRVLRRSACGSRCGAGYAFDTLGCARPTRPAPCSPRSPTPAPAGPTCPPPSACPGPTWPGSWSTARRASASRSGSARRAPSSTRTTTASTSPSPTAPPAATTWSSAPTASAPGPGGCSASSWRPTSVGMGIWRAFGPRPASVTRTDLFYGGPCYIAGYCPTGEDSLYAYLVEDAQDRCALSPEEQLATMKQLLAGLPRAVGRHPRDADRPARVNYTWFETHVLDGPWNRGRVVLIGDAAHTCPPTLAQGGARRWRTPPSWPSCCSTPTRSTRTLWDAFPARRFARAQDRRRRLRPARPVAARPRRRATSPASWAASPMLVSQPA